jgi:hypothetical protein
MTIIHSFIPIFWFSIILPIGCLPNNENVLYYYLYFYYPVLVGILPIFFSSLFSFIAFRNVRHVIRRQVPIVRQLTAMIFIRVIVYLPYAVYRIFTIVKLASSNYDIPFLFDQLMQAGVVLFRNIDYAVTSLSSFVYFYPMIFV